MDNPDGWQIDAGLAIPYLQELGWTVDWVPWRTLAVDWTDYDVVYLGVAWDYPQDPDGFLDTLRQIDAAGARLLNSLPTAQWNINKQYLRDLQERGVDIVPSAWFDNVRAFELSAILEMFAADRVVVKPVIGTNAIDSFVITRDNWDARGQAVRANFSNRAFVVQPFIDAVQSEGEYSLFFIGGKYSHAIRKKPVVGDYRVQEEYGASLESVKPEPALLRAAEHSVAAVDPVPLYARSDFVRSADNRFLLMELELIEPSMYLRLDDAAPERFARAFDVFASA